MPLANVVGKGGRLINEATAKAPLADATWPAASLMDFLKFRVYCILIDSLLHIYLVECHWLMSLVKVAN